MGERRLRVWPGSSYPLGATWDGEGVNFAIFSENATGIDLCLFDRAEDEHESARIPMREGGVGRSGAPRLSARRPPRTALRLPRARAARAAERPPFRCRQAVDRSVC